MRVRTRALAGLQSPVHHLQLFGAGDSRPDQAAIEGAAMVRGTVCRHLLRTDKVARLHRRPPPCRRNKCYFRDHLCVNDYPGLYTKHRGYWAKSREREPGIESERAAK